VGKIISSLKRTGQFDKTLIVYFHDNGACAEHLSGNGWNTANNILEWAKANNTTIAVGDQYDVPMGGPLTYGSVGHNWAHSQNTPLRRYKANVHEGGSCTPAIMHWPLGLKHEPGSITLERGHVVDMLATCLELGGGEFPRTWDGVSITDHESLSLVPVISGEKQPRDHVYYFNHGGSHAVIQGDFKIIRERNGVWALYNLAKNRTETRDLSADDPQRVQRMAALWQARWGTRKP
jgi:arylsulfatase